MDDEIVIKISAKDNTGSTFDNIKKKMKDIKKESEKTTIAIGKMGEQSKGTLVKVRENFKEISTSVIETKKKFEELYSKIDEVKKGATIFSRVIVGAIFPIPTMLAGVSVGIGKLGDGLKKTGTKFREILSKPFKEGKFEGIKELFSKLTKPAGKAGKSIGSKVIGGISGIISKVGPVAKKIGTALSIGIGLAMKGFAKVVDFGKEAINQARSKADNSGESENKTLKDNIKAIDDVGASMNNLKATIGEGLIQVLAMAASPVTKLIDGINEFVEGILKSEAAQAIFENLNSSIDMIVGLFSSLQPLVDGFFQGLTNGGSVDPFALANAGINMFKGLIQDITAALNGMNLESMGEKFGSAFSTIGEVLGEILAKAIEIVAQINWEPIINVVAIAFDVVASIIKIIWMALQPGIDLLTFIGSIIINYVAKHLEVVLTVIKVVVDIFKSGMEKIAPLWEGFGGILKTIGKVIVDFITKPLDVVKNMFETIGAFMEGFAKGGIKGGISAVKEHNRKLKEETAETMQAMEQTESKALQHIENRSNRGTNNTGTSTQDMMNTVEGASQNMCSCMDKSINDSADNANLATQNIASNMDELSGSLSTSMDNNINSSVKNVNTSSNDMCNIMARASIAIALITTSIILAMVAASTKAILSLSKVAESEAKKITKILSNIKAEATLTVKVNKTEVDSALNLPGKWTGDKNFKGGKTWLAEKGPELINPPTGMPFIAQTKAIYDLPKGTEILNAQNTRKALKAKAETYRDKFKDTKVGKKLSNFVGKSSTSNTTDNSSSASNTSNTNNTSSITPIVNITVVNNGDGNVVNDIKKAIDDYFREILIRKGAI